MKGENLLKAFSNKTRLKIISCLGQKPKNVSQMIKICGLSQSAVSQHLTKLKKLGLVRSEREGKYIYYKLASPQAKLISDKLQNFIREVKK